MNLLQAFGIDEATDKLCEIAGIEKMDWKECVECSGEPNKCSDRCNAC